MLYSARTKLATLFSHVPRPATTGSWRDFGSPVASLPAPTTFIPYLPSPKEVFRPKVLIYHPDFGQFGGIERLIATLAFASPSREHIDLIVACSDDSPLHRQLRQANLPVEGIKTHPCFAERFFWRAVDVPSLFQLLRLIVREQPDVVHVHIGTLEVLLLQFLCHLIPWMLPPKFVYTFHGYSNMFCIKDAPSIWKRLTKFAIRPIFRQLMSAMDAVLFVSLSEQVQMRAEGYLPEHSEGEVLYNGLPIQAIREAASQTDVDALRNTLDIPAASRCVAFINRLDSNKNPCHFLTFAERLGQDPAFADVHFLIAGDGVLMDEVQACVAEHPLRERIRVLGHRTDVPNLLALVDLTVNLAQFEGFGLGVLEAMAAGTVPLAYSAGGIPEVLGIPEGMPLLIDYGDLDALVARAREILTMDAPARQQLTQALQRRAEVFSQEAFMENLERVYLKILDCPEMLVSPAELIP
jgi:glycosyltransferase involved in cell wall biosynthesis